jgi:phosphatidylglycerophosphate synthase
MLASSFAQRGSSGNRYGRQPPDEHRRKRQCRLVKARSLVAAAASLAAFGVFASAAATRAPSPGLRSAPQSPADILTWSRAGAASWLCGYAADPMPGRERLIAWLMLLWGATVSDWLDGPLARRNGPTAFGAILDLEADSWLTLWAAFAAWRSGALPSACLVPPLLRYPVRWRRGLRAPMATAAWQKAAGAGQMAVLAGALAPSRSLRSHCRRLLPLAMAGQLAALGADALSLVKPPAPAAAGEPPTAQPSPGSEPPSPSPTRLLGSRRRAVRQPR